MKQKAIANRFIVLGFACLLLSISFGLIASFKYLIPNFPDDILSFQHTRPLHVFLAVSWIFAAVTGIIYRYIPDISGRPLYSVPLAKTHFSLQLATIVIAVSGFFTGHFSGREYLEFPPWITVIIILYWIMFVTNFVLTVKPVLKTAPVYVWMWCTGLLFFLITIVEANLWLLPHFNNNIVRDITVQWKANGSMVGAWNMLIYGSTMFAMQQITGDSKMGYNKISFAFYFLGLTNLMFNWGHHTYVVPAHPAVKQVAYIISMTELAFLANIMLNWRANFSKKPIEAYRLSFLFFRAADIWVLLNLILAIAISIPYINQYTHGTQITVAHAMGATIGINSLLLMGSVTFLFEKQMKSKWNKTILRGLRAIHVSLLFFWISLIGAGVMRAVALYQHYYFAQVSKRMLPFLQLFSMSGIFLAIGIGVVSYMFIKVISSHISI
ncbi:MAG: cbb3-type cytochrome c oxidase subunit I [Taibaiella sp.]|nr:cbb3-type cytochrome c oxidase subunit I [Taibaiella sp.]